jgi:hypothetical protein
MIAKDKKKDTLSLDGADKRTQVNTVVNGCRVRLNFASKTDGGATDNGMMGDIKKMILGGLSKP